MADQIEDKPNAIQRLGEGFVDNLAKVSPVVGGMIQAAVETDEYKNQKENARLDREIKKQRLLGLQQDRAVAGDKYAEWKKDAPVRDSERNLKLSALDSRAENQAMTGYRKDLLQQLSNNPLFSGMTYSEQNDFINNSPEVKAMLQTRYYADQLNKFAGNGDKDSYGRLERAISQNGYSLLNSLDKDGKEIKYLVLPGGKGMIPATPEGVQMIKDQVAKDGLKELQARAQIGHMASSQSPANDSISDYTRKLMPFNQNSAAKSMELVKGVIDDASEQEKTYHFCNRAISNFYKTGASNETKMKWLSQCIPFLKKLGYEVEGIDGKGFDISAIQIKNSEKNISMSFGEFAEHVRENDTLSKKLDSRIGLAQEAAILAQNKKATIFENMKNRRELSNAKLLAAMNKKGGVSGGSESEGAGGTGDEREADARNAAKAEIQYGQDMVKKFNLGGLFETVWRDSKDNKLIKSRDDLARIFGAAFGRAENSFSDTGSYAKAQEKFEKTLSQAGINAAHIPQVFGDNVLMQEKERLNEETKELLKKYRKAKTGPRRLYTNRMIPSESDLNREKREQNAKRLNEIDALLAKKAKSRKEEMKKREERRNKFRQRRI